jgi:drug/metabolite transporter (DMT)-like permease
VEPSLTLGADGRVGTTPNRAKRRFVIDRLAGDFAAVVLGGGAPVALIIGAALQFAPIAHAGALYQRTVLLAVACLAAIVLKERIATIRKMGLVFVVCGGSMIGGLDLSSFGGRRSIGHLLFLLASFMTACYTVAIRRARVDGLHAAAIAAVVSLLLYLPAYLVFFENELFRVPVSDLVFQALHHGVVTTAISLALYGRAIHLLGASKAAAFVALGPIMAALMAIPVLGEWPSHIASAAILILRPGST